MGEAMKERPILFRGEMVRAILEGRKTQTRRVIKPQPNLTPSGMMNWKGLLKGRTTPTLENGEFEFIDEWVSSCPYGQPGDRLWVRETIIIQVGHKGRYKADGVWFSFPKDYEVNYDKKTIPSIFMPRWASRIMLGITNIRVEKLQEITEEDAEREGIEIMQRPASVGGGTRYFAPASGDRPPYWEYSAGTAFMYLWDSINGKKYPWSSNPWVWVIEFKKL